jgi:hypothetical protein
MPPEDCHPDWLSETGRALMRCAHITLCGPGRGRRRARHVRDTARSALQVPWKWHRYAALKLLAPVAVDGRRAMCCVLLWLAWRAGGGSLGGTL